MRRFPEEANKVKEIALLHLPLRVLKKVGLATTLVEKIAGLKKKFLRKRA
jgi:hypothetical protein